LRTLSPITEAEAAVPKLSSFNLATKSAKRNKSGSRGTLNNCVGEQKS